MGWQACWLAVFLAAWLCCNSVVRGQTCSLSSSITKAPGVVQDRASLSGLYAASMECHWQITSTQANTVVELTFDLLNLVQYRGSNNDVLLVNLGSSKPGASIPKGWAAYRRHEVSAGTDDIGMWDYSSSNGDTNVCPATSFDPVTTDLTTGSLLTDPQRNLTWIYFTGAYTPDADNAMTLTSSASDVYIVFRSLPLYFVLSWRVVPSYCAPATVLSPRVDVSDTITTSASYTVQDNVVGQMQPNITCVWHLQPFRLDANPDCDAIGETNQPKLCTPSTSTAAYSGSQGKLSTGECLFCTLPPSLPGNSTFIRSENVINLVAPKSLPMVTWDGDYIEQSCPFNYQCPQGNVCTTTGKCVAVLPDSSPVLGSSSSYRKQCVATSDCPAFTVCDTDTFQCEAPDSLGLSLTPPSTVCSLVGLTNTSIFLGLTIEVRLRLASAQPSDTIVAYPGLNSLTALAPLVAVPTLTKDTREACIFPFTLPLRDCTAFESYVATKAYNAAAFVAVAKPYAYATLDQLVQPCQCNTMPPWNTSNYVITRVNSTAPPSVTVQITYNYIKTQVTAGGPQTNQCASQCFFIENTIQGPPLTPALPFNSSANATFVSGTTAKRYTMTREFMFQQDAHNIWQVVGTDVARTERCVVEGPDEAVVATSVSVFSCQTIGGSASDPPSPQPYCVLQNTKKTCLAEQNGCGIENGQVVYTSTGGSFEDGYESSSVTDGVHKCTFNIYPAIHPKALEPFAVLTYVVPKSQLGQGDVLAVTTSIGTSANLISGSTVRTLMQREAEFTLSTAGDKSGTPGDGFIVEFDTVYSFPTAPTAHFCSNAVTTLSFQDSVVFPTYSFDNSTLVLSPNSISNCDFILQAANASAGSVVWVQFLSLALTSDRIDLFDLNADSTPSSLLATITSTSYSVEHSAVHFNGATDYLVSDMPVEVPSSILFWIQVASTLTADCTVASACLANNIPKPMKVLGSDNHFPGFNVVLAPDTGVLSVQLNTGRSFSLLFDVRLSSWLHVAIVRRNSDLFGYIDGTLVPVASAATTSNATTTPTISQGLLYIGGQPSLPDATNIYFSGQLRHVVLFSEPKTVFEINRQMNLPCEESDVSLVVCYSFQTRLDLSRFANHLHFHGPSILQSSALVLSHNLRKIFTANSSKVLLRYSSPTSSATADTFRLVAWSTFCVVPCFGDCDDRGHCVCRPGTSGRHCNVTIPPCSNHVIVPEGSGTITLPSPSSTVVRDHHFVPDISSRGGFGALVDCSWHIQQSNSIVMLDMQLVDLTDDNVILSIYDGDRVAPMYTSAYNLSAAMAMDRAAFFSRGQVQYTQAVIRNISSTVALATLWPSTFNASACSKVYHVVTFERGKVCADASAVGLSRRLASETIATFWWTLSSSAYASVLTTSQLYFNSFDQNSANITVEYHLRPIDARSNADTSPYPALFRLRRRISSFSTCKDGSDVNLDGLSGQLAEFTSVLRPDLGTSGYTDQCLVTPLFDYAGNWAIDASKLYYGAFRTKFVLDQVQSMPFTMVVQAEVVLTTKDQYIFSQENQAVGSIFLKFAPTTKASGVWIFGTVGQNDGVASTNPTSFTGESVHLAITVVSGVWTYYVNGVRHSTLNTVTNYQTCVATGRASCQLPILTFSDVQNRLVIGATVSNGQGDGFWIGTIQRVKVYKSALSEAIIGCLAGGSRATVIQSTVVNAVASSTNSTTATLSTIDITTVTVQATSVISRLVREWTLVRSPCQVPPTSLQLDGNAVAYMLNVPDVQLSPSLVWNSFDDTLAQLSWRNGSLFSQSTLKRSKRYGFGLTTELIVRLLTEYGNLVENTPYHITRLYVNSIGPTGAVVSFTLANVFRSSVDAKATLVRFNDTWLVPESIERLVPPDFGVVPPVKCISSTNFTASAGYFSDGQPTETSPSVHDTLCKWEIQAPPAQTIRLQLDLFNIDCTEGVLLLVDLDTAVSTALCGNLTTRSITVGRNMRFVFGIGPATGPQPTKSTGFYAKYWFSGHNSTQNTTDFPATYSNWTLVETSPTTGTSQCQVDASAALSPLYPWQVQSVSLTSTFNRTCYATEMQSPNISQWDVESVDYDGGSPTCLQWEHDDSMPWTATDVQISRTNDLTSIPPPTLVTQSSPALELTSHSSIPLIPFQSTKSSAEIRFQSQGRGGRSRVVVAYSTRKVYYVAPPSYRPADGSMGDGSLDAPFTTAFADLFANVLSDGDLLRLFPGRYSGSSYCNLVVTKAVGVDSIGGPDRTIVDCLGTFRGWQLAHVRGLTTITGITFTQCTVCIHVHTFGESSRILHQVASNVHGAALWISGPTVLHQCRFVHNTDGIGIVAVVAPSASRLVDCEFELNVGRSALAILSATVTVADSRFLNNTSIGTEEIVVVTRYEGTGGANVLGNPASATVSNCTFARNSGAAALGLKFSSNAVVTNCSFLSNQAGGITVFAAMLVFTFNSAQDNNTTGLLGTVGGSITSTWNVFDSNRADYGGAVFVTAATSFLSNSAGPDSSTTDFATTFTGGAISFQNGAHIDFKSNLFRGNSASTAGGASTFPA
ncbi:hypothetical protein DYB26_003721 [Aphanomyces astaci]|uniref:CUB domain-containing protein n=1 Tax=Aphanomyces astaci TaxID=112090 RepID=A0A3R6XVN0_APHAT|nr:hypothetical protein DYB26_003721 [Aphanomyces astaci]